MDRLWSFLVSKKNREIIGWVGGGAAVVIAGLWTVFVYFHPPKNDGDDSRRGVTASHGGIAIGGDVTGSTVKAGSNARDDDETKGK
jgi:hypothetical protein